MNTVKEIKNETGLLRNYKTMLEMYEEIAAMKTRKTKMRVLLNRSFMEGVGKLLGYVVTNYRRELAKRRADPKNKTSTYFMQTNGKTVAVLLSANTGLYGDIVAQVSDVFFEYIEKNKADPVIVGRVGKQAMDFKMKHVDYTYFSIPDIMYDPRGSKELIAHIVKYSNILIFHGKYISALRQDPVVTTISTLEASITDEEYLRDVQCIIEPSVEVVASFFEKQILSSLTDHAFFESSLSKYASRMLSLDIATENLNKRIKKLGFQALKLAHRDSSRKQHSSLSGLSLWS